MKSKAFTVSIALAVVVSATASIYAQQSARARTAAQPRTNDIFAFVPQSDSILVVNVNRLLNETLPRIFAGDSAKLAQINSEIDKFKAETGIDARAFKRVVVAARYTYPSVNVTKLEPVAIAEGKVDVKQLTEKERQTGKWKVREEKYRGTTITVFVVGDQVKLFGLWNMRVRELAVGALNANAVAVGTPATVRAAIDAGKTPRRDNVELVSLATRDPQAVIGFGANVPQTLWANLNLGTDAIAQDANSIRQAYGSVGTTATDVSLVLVARTETSAAAKNLGDTLTGLKQVAAFMIMQMSADKRALAQSALSNLTINARGNELEIRTQVKAATLASVMK